MSKQPVLEVPPGSRMLSMAELASAIFKAEGITTGFWRLGCHLRFAGSTFGYEEADGAVSYLPTGLVGVVGMGLTPVDGPGELVFNAAELTQPARRPAAKKVSRRKDAA